jgi:hypothetical protein
MGKFLFQSLLANIPVHYNVTYLLCGYLDDFQCRDLCNDHVICSYMSTNQTTYCSKLYGYGSLRDLSMIASRVPIRFEIGLCTMPEHRALTHTSTGVSNRPWKYYAFQFVLESDLVLYFDRPF